MVKRGIGELVVGEKAEAGRAEESLLLLLLLLSSLTYLSRLSTLRRSLHLFADGIAHRIVLGDELASRGDDDVDGSDFC